MLRSQPLHVIMLQPPYSAPIKRKAVRGAQLHVLPREENCFQLIIYGCICRSGLVWDYIYLDTVLMNNPKMMSTAEISQPELHAHSGYRVNRPMLGTHLIHSSQATSPSACCPTATILQCERGDEQWRYNETSCAELLDKRDRFITSPVCLIFTRFTVQECQTCRSSLVEAFGMPDVLRSRPCQDANGYFGCGVTKDQGVVTGFNMWSLFEVKEIDQSGQYKWHKVSTFVRWLISPRQVVIIIFDAGKLVRERLLKRLFDPELSCLNDPFWVCQQLAREIVHLHDSAVWSIRDLVRGIETKETQGGRPQPEYRHLHEIARHAVHVSESLNVTIDALEGMIAQHKEFLKHFDTEKGIDADDSENIRRQLCFYKSLSSGLSFREESNRARLQNEIQLAFNMAAQYDTAISVEIGRASKADSSAMKTIAFFTMAFLPATFLSSIFSMSFFDYDADADVWSISAKFWIYWAFTLPITLAAFGLWYFWHKISPFKFV
ncbi:hypothetical protein GGR54DRAFT_592520 [Hypoxylon sp. NC1633]|nr:hypothetical protein GGR54DRAFT_592520 [Hypoxylon sp. NC1633]